MVKLLRQSMPGNHTPGVMPQSPEIVDDHAGDIASWFFQLRWVAVAGQFLTILAVRYGLNVEIPFNTLLTIIIVTALTNLALALWHFQRGDHFPIPGWTMTWRSVLGVVMAVDLLILTLLLYYCGGPSNPFSIFYLVNLCLAGVILSSQWAWGLEFLAVICFFYLLFDHVPLSILETETLQPTLRKGGTLTTAQAGLFVAFDTCSLVIVYFTTMVTGRLRDREQELRRVEQERARGEKLEALGTLAAGAAHELASPLSTIAIIATELSREAEQADAPEMIREDIRLIRSEVDRCRKILDQMSADAGHASWEQTEHLLIEELYDEIQDGLKQIERVDFVIEESAKNIEMMAPARLLAQALRGLIKNGLEATPLEKHVSCRARSANTGKGKFSCELVIEDQGEGISEEILQRIGEPFFTTKPVGRGMGLGFFLARSVVERLNGSLNLKSHENVGTQVTIRLPAVIRETDVVEQETRSE